MIHVLLLFDSESSVINKRIPHKVALSWPVLSLIFRNFNQIARFVLKMMLDDF